jgi:hypothetical protein
MAAYRAKGRDPDRRKVLGTSLIDLDNALMRSELSRPSCAVLVRSWPSSAAVELSSTTGERADRCALQLFATGVGATVIM